MEGVDSLIIRLEEASEEKVFWPPCCSNHNTAHEKCSRISVLLWTDINLYDNPIKKVPRQMWLLCPLPYKVFLHKIISKASLLKAWYHG
jgi:hypothetical protein